MDGVDISAELADFRDGQEVSAVIGAVTDADGLLALDVVGTTSRDNSRTVASFVGAGLVTAVADDDLAVILYTQGDTTEFGIYRLS